jgi:hypothetical protein
MKNKLRNFLLRDFREEVLCKIIIQEIEKLEDLKNKKLIKILDYGSGYSPVLIKKIVNKLSKKYKNTIFKAYCFDYYSNEHISLLNKNNSTKIKFFNIKKLKSIKMNFNFCLIVDVLHHIGINKGNKIYKTTRMLKKICKFIIIKDHFQYGFFSNLILVLMDFFGNYFDGVKIPNLYFDKKSYKKFLKKIPLKEIRSINNKKYYKWYWLYINNKKLQFVSIVK